MLRAILSQALKKEGAEAIQKWSTPQVIGGGSA
jgi:hypothetical protein